MKEIRKVLENLFQEGQQFERDGEAGESGNSQELITIAENAIIARLRAGEKLLGMMRLIELRTDESGETWFSIFNERGRSALINFTSHGPIVRGALADFEERRKKAIAEYEGKP